MTETTQNAIDALQALRLPELRTRYAEVVGEETKCPNKTWLVRKITEALAGQDAEAGIAEPPAQPQADDDHHGAQAPLQALAAPDATPATPKLTKMTVEALQARYVEVVGRPTHSTNASYLIWKIRQAEKGKVPVGPRAARTSDGEAVEFKVLPLRMEAELVQRLDEARERLGMKSRMELFRRALGVYLAGVGEAEVAALFGVEG
jgi:hypothetical protein